MKVFPCRFEQHLDDRSYHDKGGWGSGGLLIKGKKLQVPTGLGEMEKP